MVVLMPGLSLLKAFVPSRRGETEMLITGALDVWSLGVMLWEFFMGARALHCGRDQIFAAMAGSVPLPWEELSSAELTRQQKRMGILHTVIPAMLERDPRQRVTMQEVCDQLQTLLRHEYTATCIR